MARADDVLTRLAHVIPAASRDGGVSIDEVAQELEVSRDRILADIATVADRDFYHPGGWFSEIVILTSSDRVEVDRAGAFERPAKLNAREALCLAIGLRGLGGESFASADQRTALMARVEGLVAAGQNDPELDSGLEIADDVASGTGLDEVLLDGTRERLVCRIRYMTRSEGGRRIALDRDIEPHVMARSEGHWYAIAWCRLREGVRAFRLDRVITAVQTEERFEPRDAFDANAWVEEGRVYLAKDETAVRVRYSPAVARWAREEAIHRNLPFEDLDDGAVSVEYKVADWDWIVRRVLGYGPDAEVLGPSAVRDYVSAVLTGVSP